MNDSLQKEALEKKIEEQLNYEKLNDLCEHLKDAICEIFDSCGLYFRIFSRVKTKESIANKILQRRYGTDENPKKLQDLIGLRIVLYYYDDLPICRDIMESTFRMLGHWSKTNFNADEFKAAKINGVFKYPIEYLNLCSEPLWDLPIDTTFEIQFRTVFFEGWHEIEHDMRYKSILSDELFWQGSEELSRILNCILANLELCDWSLVQLFDQLSYNHYKNGNWELMLKSHYRIKIDESVPLDADIIQLFNSNRELAKQFYKNTKEELIRGLLKLDTPHVTYNLIIQVINEEIVHDKTISSILDTKEIISSIPHSFQRNMLAPLETNTLFALNIPLFHKEARDLCSEFRTASNIIFKWAKFKMSVVFQDIPNDLSSYLGQCPGYSLQIQHSPEDSYFQLNLVHIDSQHAGTIWHVVASIYKTQTESLQLSLHTFRNTPHGATQRETFSKPAFLSELSSKVGLCDIVRLGNKAKFIETEEDLEFFFSFIHNEKRRLPIVLIIQSSHYEALNTDSFADEYDMNSFPINGMRLAKVIGLYAHVYMLNKELLQAFAARQSQSDKDLDSSIMIFWKNTVTDSPVLFTAETICNTQFDFNRFAFHDNNINEKAFRHKLVQMIKSNNVQFDTENL